MALTLLLLLTTVFYQNLGQQTRFRSRHSLVPHLQSTSKPMPTCLLPNSTESTAWFVSTVFLCRYTRKKLTVLLDAYSGALLFVAFLSEMRQPLDFWKAVFLAQAFITVVYVFFGAFVRIIPPRPYAGTNKFRPTPTTASTATLLSPRLSSHLVSKC